MASIEAEMPEDVMMEILSLIPVKSLLRFKSVSKKWYSLIQNPTFISLHHTHAQPKNYLIAKKQVLSDGQLHDDAVFSMYMVPGETSPMQDLDLSSSGIDRDVKGVFFLGCHNGVMCLANDFTSSVVIFNPATRESRVLPQPLYESKRRSNLGFTFDPKANDFKVIRFRAVDDYKSSYLNYNNNLGDNKVQIYDMSIDSWRETDTVVPIDFPGGYEHHCCPSLDGVFYWYYHGSDMVFAFRMFEEQFEQIPLPYSYCYEYCSVDLCRLHDSLAFALLKDEYDPVGDGETCVDIWIMDDYGSGNVSWTKRYTIGPILGRHIMSGFWPNGELLLTCHWPADEFLCYYGQIVSYNLSTQEIKKYNFSSDNVEVQGFPYAESLISVKRLSD